MKDVRIQHLARTLVKYCINARPRQTVGLSSGLLAMPLVEATYEELIKAGSYPVLRLSTEAISESLFRHGQAHHFEEIQPFAKAYAKCVDSTISIYSQSNTQAMSGVDPFRQTRLARTMKPISERMSHKAWVITLYPTEAYAQDAGMSLSAFEDFVFAATFSDRDDPIAAWKSLGKQQAKVVSRLRGADEVHIVGPGTDLKLSVRGRTFVNSAGHRNMPSGEVFAAPIETSAEGTIEFDYPVCRDGREIEGVRLVFRKGRVVESSARKNEAFLKAMLKTDAGASRLGELGIGTNAGIQRFIKNILFDEKIGGTIHLALGRAPLDTGGRNQSAIHWDMIKDLRRGGSIHVNGRLFQKDGTFI